MKKIAKSSVLFAFVALISAQSSAEVTVQKVTLKQYYARSIENLGSIYWSGPAYIGSKLFNDEKRALETEEEEIYERFCWLVAPGFINYRGPGVLIDHLIRRVAPHLASRSGLGQGCVIYIDPNADETLAKNNRYLISPKDILSDFDLSSLMSANIKCSSCGSVPRGADRSSKINPFDYESNSFDELCCYSSSYRWKGIYAINFSLQPSEIKNLIVQVAYALRLDYEAAKATGDKKKQDQIDSWYNAIRTSIQAAQISNKQFVFQIPDRTVDGTKTWESFWEHINSSYLNYKYSKKLDKVTVPSSKELKERDFIYVVLDEKAASREVPQVWHDRKLKSNLMTSGSLILHTTNNHINNSKKEDK